MIFICLTKVLLPDSPAPVEREGAHSTSWLANTARACGHGTAYHQSAAGDGGTDEREGGGGHCRLTKKKQLDRLPGQLVLGQDLLLDSLLTRCLFLLWTSEATLGSVWWGQGAQRWITVAVGGGHQKRGILFNVFGPRSCWVGPEFCMHSHNNKWERRVRRAVT
jgi:hypothetical protein